MEEAANLEVTQERQVGQCNQVSSLEHGCRDIRSGSRLARSPPRSPRLRDTTRHGDEPREDASRSIAQETNKSPPALLLGAQVGQCLAPLQLPGSLVGQVDLSPAASVHDDHTPRFQAYGQAQNDVMSESSTRASTGDEPLLFSPAVSEDMVNASKSLCPAVGDIIRERAELAKEREALSRERADLDRQWEELARARADYASSAISSRFVSNRRYDHRGRLIGTRKRDRISLCFKRFFCGIPDDSELEEQAVVVLPPGQTASRRFMAVPEAREIGRERFSAPPSLPSVNEEAQSLPRDLDTSSYYVGPGDQTVRSVSVASYRSARSRSRETATSGFFSRRRPNSRSRSRSAAPSSSRVSSASKCDDDQTTHDSSSLYQGAPLEIFKQTVADTLAKIALSRNLDDALIRKMAEASPDPKSNAEIKAQLLEICPDLQIRVRASFTPLTFRNLVLGFVGVVDGLRDTELSRLVEIFENQWLIKVRPGANKIIDGQRALEDYHPASVYEYCSVALKQDSAPFALADVIERDRRNHKPAGEGVLWAQRIMELIEGLLSRLFEIVPIAEEETLSQYLCRLSKDARDWRTYWRDNYSNSRCRHEVLGFVVGKLVDAKMKGSAALLYPPAMVEHVFEDSLTSVQDFLIDLRLAMRMLDLLL